jgi:integrase
MSKVDGKWKRIDSFFHQISGIRKPIKYTLNEHPMSNNLCYYFRYDGDTYRGSTGETFDNIDYCHTMVKEIIYNTTQTERSQRKKQKGKKIKITKFEDVVKGFLLHKKNENLSPKTLYEYHRQSKYLLEFFKGRDINSFGEKKDYEDYTNWRKKYYDTHKGKIIKTYKGNGKVFRGRKFENGVGDVSINRENQILVSILIYSKEYLGHLKGIEIQHYKKIDVNEKDRDTVKYWEYKKLKKYWEEKNPYYWKIISFVDKSGIRYPSELLKITNSDVNLKEGFVLIRNRKSKKKKIINTKVPLIEETKKILEELRSREGIPKGPNDPVFVNDKGIQIKYINKGFKKSLSELGINENLTMYSFRHTYTTRMVKNPEIPLIMVSRILGHRDTQMVDRKYSHLTDNDVLRTFQRMEEKKKKS